MRYATKPVVFLILAFGISWISWGIRNAYWIPQFRPDLSLLIKFGPSLAGVLTLAFCGKLAGLGRQLLPGPQMARWSLLGLIVPFLVLGIAALPWVLTSSGLGTDSGLGALAALLAIRTFSGGVLGEELGWRGVLQPLLAARWAPFQAAMLVGAIWALWHLPATGIFGAVLLMLLTVPAAILLAWLQLRSNSLWPCILMHGAGNAVAAWLPEQFPQLNGQLAWPMLAAIILLGLAVVVSP